MKSMRTLIESVEQQELSEGKYGPHGMGRRVNNAVDAIFDAQLDGLGNDPTIEEIYASVREVRKELAAQELMGFPRTNSYINKQYIGAVAEKLKLPGLYAPSGKTFYSVKKDEAGRYTGSGRASKRTAQALAEKGYLSKEAAERLGVTKFLGMEFGDGNSDDANATRNAQTMASGRRQVRRDVSRFLELLAKKNEAKSEGVEMRSPLARVIIEALSDEEEKEFQELLSKVKLLDPSSYDDDETKELVQQAKDAVDSMPKTYAVPADRLNAPKDIAAAAQAASDDSGDQDATVDPGEGKTSGSLEAFAKSGKGGLANDADETAAIEELQQFLLDMGIDPNGVDGKYGGGTTKAVKQFQKTFGAAQDGDAGPETIGKIIEYRNDLAEMDDLIAAAGSTPQGGRGDGNAEVAQRRADAQQQNASIDFRHLVSIVESNLFEALDDAQRTRAQELIEKYEALVGNLPEPAKAQLQEKIDALKAALEGQGMIGQDPNASNDAEDGEAVYKVVTGSGQGRRYTTFDADGNEVASGRGPGPNLPTREEYEGQGNTVPFNAQEVADKIKDAITGMGTDEQAVYDAIDETGSSENWAQVLKAYPEVYNDIYGDFSGRDLELIKSKLQNIGVTMPDEGEEAGAATATATDGTEEPASAREVWDQIKAMRDEQPKPSPERTRLNRLMNSINKSTTTPEEAAEILAQAKQDSDTTSNSPTVEQRLQAAINADIGSMSSAEVTQWAKDLMQDSELLATLPKDYQDTIKLLAQD